MASKFKQLEKIAQDFRSSKQIFTDGQWKLKLFYDGLVYDSKERLEENWETKLSKLREWLKMMPDSITAHVALSSCMIKYAFHGRGYGYAHTVSEDRRKLFRERLKEATKIFNNGGKLQQKCPEWWSVAQGLALARGLNRLAYDSLFNQAIQFEPLYTHYYFKKAIYLLPRWYGKKGEWEQFAYAAGDAIGGEHGNILYARIILFMDTVGPYDAVTWESPQISWSRVKKGFEALRSSNLNDYPGKPEHKSRFKNNRDSNDNRI